MPYSKLQIEPGNIHTLGSSSDAHGVNFALFSSNAEKVELCLFSNDGSRELQRLALPDCTSHVWNGYVKGLQPGAVYGYRVYGPYAPELGHRFNHHKLLLDPMRADWPAISSGAICTMPTRWVQKMRI